MASTVFDFRDLSRSIGSVTADAEKAQGEGPRNFLVVGEKVPLSEAPFLQFFAAAFREVPDMVIFEDEPTEDDAGKTTRHFLNADDFEAIMGLGRLPTIEEAEAFIVEMSPLMSRLVYEDGYNRARAKRAEEQRAREMQARREAYEAGQKSELNASWEVFKAKRAARNLQNEFRESQPQGVVR